MELSDKYIFILGLARYNSNIESTTFTFAKHLAKRNRVVYIENPYTWKDLLKKSNRQSRAKVARQVAQDGSGLIDTGIENLKVLLMPPLVSINWLPEGGTYRWLLQRNEAVMADKVRAVIKREKVDKFIFINSFNFYYPNIGKMLRPELLVYHCVDPLFYDVELKHGVISEDQIVRASDLVVCTSKRLYEEKKPQNAATYFIPNAADINHSSKALRPELTVHEHVSAIKKPVVGYFGNIERRLDYALIDQVTQQNPEVNFVFAGPVIKEFTPAWFYQRPNIHLTGPVPYDAMPQVLKGFDVAMIPFKKDEVSSTIFPLKLFEYLGAGKPVVATDFNPDLEEFTDKTVTYCSDPVAFTRAIQAGLSGDCEESRQSRLHVAAQNTWEKRCAEFSGLLAKHLKQKQGERA